MEKILRFITTLDRRWIFVLMTIVTFLFIAVINIQSEIPITRASRAVYETIENLPEGARVNLSIDYGPSSAAELWPMHQTMLRHLWRKKAKVICTCLWVDSPPMVERGWEEISKEFAAKGEPKVYGKDFVNLGFKAGDRTAIASIGNSFKKTFPTDNRGNRTDRLPIMQGWDTYREIDLLISIAVGDPGPIEYVQQAQSRYGVKMITGCTAVLSPQLFPFFQSGNIQGFLNGLSGAAEYELLCGEMGAGRKGMNVQSAIHMLIVALVLLGNIAAFLLKFYGTSPINQTETKKH